MYKIFAILLVAVAAGGVNGATKPVNEVSRALLGDPEGTANHTTFQIQIRKITVQICGNFLFTQYFLWVSNPK